MCSKQIKAYESATFHVFMSFLHFENNGDQRSTRLGGAIFMDYNEVLYSRSLLVISNSKFINCSAEFGAAIHISVGRWQRGAAYKSTLRNHSPNPKRTKAMAMLPILLNAVEFVNNTARAKGIVSVIHMVIDLVFR